MQTIMILTKDEYLIRVKKAATGNYRLEFSKDRFKTYRPKEYNNREELMEVLTFQFTEEELVGI